ncbi:MAG: hypothetical protein ACK5D5_13415 [Bacteroidota bacterium]|jgi:hypothetical protein
MNSKKNISKVKLNFNLVLFFALLLLPTKTIFSQGIGDIIVIPVQVDPDQTVKSFEKINDRPEVIDSSKRIENITYNITSKAFKTYYQPSPINSAKMANEPLSKLYRMLIKGGYGNYNMPYGELHFNNLRNKEYAFGVNLKHLSSNWQLEDRGYSGFSDNELYLNGKKFLKTQTLSANLNYMRNVIRFYGYTPNPEEKSDSNIEKQTFNFIESKINLTSHLPDSSKLNHSFNLNFHYMNDSYKMNELFVGGNGLLKSNIKGEKLNVMTGLEYYNNRMDSDTISNIIFRLMPYFEAGGKKWKADLGLLAVIDQYTDSTPKFNFYPRINFYYDVYKSIIIPYAGLGGDLKKNSFRSLTQENPFLVSDPQFKNTSYNLEIFGGLRGSLSSKTNYDVSANYKKVTDLPLYVIDYNLQRGNRFKVVFDEGSILNFNAQIKYSHKEKLNITASGGYYMYTLKNNQYAWHRPTADVKLSANYNIRSKIITKLDVYYISNQWALRTTNYSGGSVTGPVNLKGIADVNFGMEYRYSKFLSAFVNFNNIANFRYYRWDNYPTQRFNFLLGFSFIPF